MLVTLAEAKEYLRIDTTAEDTTLQTLLDSALKLCADVSRLDVETFETKGDVAKIAVLYTIGYFYENRVDADYNKLPLFLRSLLFSIREG